MTDQRPGESEVDSGILKAATSMKDFENMHPRKGCSAAALLAAFWLLLGGIPVGPTSSDDLDIGAPRIAGGTTFTGGV
jgi:hypothetical protein